MKIQMLGLCRFSLLSEGGFKVVHETLEERRRHLYDPVRLEQRFVWFEHVALPGWAKQTDRDFKLVVAVAEDFPALWLDRLRDLSASIPGIIIELCPLGHHRDVCRHAMLRHADRTADRLVLFRHDDDDAVAIDYVEMTRRDLLRMRAMAEDHPLFFMDYARGFTLEYAEGEVHMNPQITHTLGVALNIVAPAGHDRGALDYPHHRLSTFMPGLCLSGPQMYLRGKHETNDSRPPSRGGSPFFFKPETAPAVLAERFAIDLPGFEAALRR
ncbi:glycosyltransferase [Falsirhodobacter sp. 1013]|uniref:glycosyltransferase n=1 Tax=Falsirhodobacter sp. 1013 TaxID=3417566 RepID=UPI003EBBAFB7